MELPERVFTSFIRLFPDQTLENTAWLNLPATSLKKMKQVKVGWEQTSLSDNFCLVSIDMVWCGNSFHTGILGNR
jgi:hypothetical protein